MRQAIRMKFRDDLEYNAGMTIHICYTDEVPDDMTTDQFIKELLENNSQADDAWIEETA